MNEIHEPKMIENAKNAAVYFVVVSGMTCGLVLFMAAMFSPIFIPWIHRNIDAWYANHPEHPNPEKGKKKYRTLSHILVAIAFILSWTLFIVLNHNNRGTYGH